MNTFERTLMFCMKTAFRKKSLLLLVFCCCLFLLKDKIVALSPFESSEDHGVVASCIDGDTVKLMDRRIVRLAGIDSPELSRKKSVESQYYSREARDMLTDLAQGQKVRIVNVSSKPKDRYGRIVADLQREKDGKSLSELMLQKGAAFFYPLSDLSKQFRERLHNLQKSAVKERQGLWRALLDLPLAKQNYVGNNNTMRFFPADCPSVQDIKPRNRVYFGTLMDAFMAGFAPARVCLFWPPDAKR